MTTLQSKWHFVLLASFLYVTNPLVDAAYYLTQEGRGAYAPGADTIAIPIYQSAGAMLLLSPVYTLAVWLAARSYRGGRSLLDFDPAKPLRSAFWSLLLGGLAVYDVGYAVYSAGRALPVEAAASLLWAYLLLCLRSSLTGRSGSASSLTPPKLGDGG